MEKEKVNLEKMIIPNEILSRSTSVLAHFAQIQLLKRVCIDQFRKIQPNLSIINTEKISFCSGAFIQLASYIPIIVSELKIMQNKSLRLIGHACNLDTNLIPKSMNQAMNKGLEKYGFDNEVKKIIKNYWNTSGLDIKKYRDIDQHYYEIINYSGLQLIPKIKPVIYLPDDPSIRSVQKFTYTKRIEAVNFLKRSFKNIHNFIDSIFKLKGYNPYPINQWLDMSIASTIDRSKKYLLSVFIDESISQNNFLEAVFDGEKSRIVFRTYPEKTERKMIVFYK